MVRHPRGPLPAQVYWYRRLGLFAVLAALVVLLIVSFAIRPGGTQRVHQVGGGTRPSGTSTGTSPAGAGNTPTASPTTTNAPAVSGTAGASTAATPAASASTALQTCSPAALSLTLHTSADTYPAGIAPTFTATLRTTGPACAAPGPLAFAVASGPDRVWVSTDCSPAAGSPSELPAAGAAGASRTWQRSRSAPGCGPAGDASTAAAGTYRVTASWAGVHSAEVVFHLR